MAPKQFKMPKNIPDVVLNPNAAIVLTKRYLRKGPDGQPIETPKQLFWRVASTIAREEEKYSKPAESVRKLAVDFYEMMVGYRFLPNSPTLMNAGTDLGQLSACFVLPVGTPWRDLRRGEDTRP